MWKTIGRAALGLVVGAAIGGFIAHVTIPSHEQLRGFAEDLVPPGTTATGSSIVSGFEPLVGPPEAWANFNIPGADVAAVAETVRHHAAQLGWTYVRTDDFPAGEVQHWSRDEARASIHLPNSEGDEDGAIAVRYHASPMDRLINGAQLGAVAGLLLALVSRRLPLPRRR